MAENLSNSFKNLSTAAALAMGPMAGLAARLSAFNTLVKDTGVDIALISAALLGFTTSGFKAVGASGRLQHELMTLDQIIKSVGRSGEISSGMVDSFASSLSKATDKSSTEIRDLAKQFLLFDKVSADFLERSITAAVSISSTRGEDAQEWLDKISEALVMPENMNDLNDNMKLFTEEEMKQLLLLQRQGRLYETAETILSRIEKRGLSKALDIKETNSAINAVNRLGKTYDGMFENIERNTDILDSAAKFFNLIEKGVDRLDARIDGLNTSELKALEKAFVNVGEAVSWTIGNIDEMFGMLAGTSGAYIATGLVTKNPLIRMLMSVVGGAEAVGNIQGKELGETTGNSIAEGFSKSLFFGMSFIADQNKKVMERAQKDLEDTTLRLQMAGFSDEEIKKNDEYVKSLERLQAATEAYNNTRQSSLDEFKVVQTIDKQDEKKEIENYIRVLEGAVKGEIKRYNDLVKATENIGSGPALEAQQKRIGQSLSKIATQYTEIFKLKGKDFGTELKALVEQYEASVEAVADKEIKINAQRDIGAPDSALADLELQLRLAKEVSETFLAQIKELDPAFELANQGAQQLQQTVAEATDSKRGPDLSALASSVRTLATAYMTADTAARTHKENLDVLRYAVDNLTGSEYELDRANAQLMLDRLTIADPEVTGLRNYVIQIDALADANKNLLPFVSNANVAVYDFTQALNNMTNTSLETMIKKLGMAEDAFTGLSRAGKLKAVAEELYRVQTQLADVRSAGEGTDELYKTSRLAKSGGEQSRIIEAERLLDLGNKYRELVGKSELELIQTGKIVGVTFDGTTQSVAEMAKAIQNLELQAEDSVNGLKNIFETMTNIKISKVGMDDSSAIDGYTKEDEAFQKYVEFIGLTQAEQAKIAAALGITLDGTEKQLKQIGVRLAEVGNGAEFAKRKIKGGIANLFAGFGGESNPVADFAKGLDLLSKNFSDADLKAARFEATMNIVGQSLSSIFSNMSQLYAQNTENLRNAYAAEEALRDKNISLHTREGDIAAATSQQKMDALEEQVKASEKQERRAFEMKKQADMASVVMSTATGAMMAFAQLGPVAGPAAAAMVVAAGAMQLAAIKATTFQGGGALGSIPSGGPTLTMGASGYQSQNSGATAANMNVTINVSTPSGSMDSRSLSQIERATARGQQRALGEI